MQAVFRRHPRLASAAIIIMALGLALRLLNIAPPPVEVLSGDVSPKIVRAGEPVRITFVVNRNEICPTTIMSFWENEDHDPTPTKLPPRSRFIPQLGKKLSVFVPDLVAPMETGTQCYRSHVLHRCPGGNVMVDTPPVCVQVVPALEAGGQK